MRPEILKAAVKRAHELGKPVIAHPSYLRGLELTIEGGVDILAHTTQDPVNWTDEVVSRLRAANVGLVPTLTLFSTTREFEGILREVKSYADAGGELLFGTDIGFLTHYSELTREYEFLGRAGLRFPQVLAMLTTAPAKRFDRAERGGRIAVGAEADLVVVNGDPSADLRALAQVRCTIRNGRVIYRSPE
jgi:imidazolonepropionase-like amidohydrolase